MADDGGEQSNRDVKLGIIARLKKVPPVSSPRSARVVNSLRSRKVDPLDKAAEVEARRMVEDHFKQEGPSSLRSPAKHKLKIDVADPMADFVLIDGNEYVNRENKEQEEDIPVCKCVYVKQDPDSACGRQCLNKLSNTECAPTSCPCGDQCKNQRFQRNQYAETKLLKTDKKGWGLASDDNLKAGDFVIEYCGEVIPKRKAQSRAKSYKSSGLKNSYIISLNRADFIDATQKGSLGRFINHSCEPNCETRKWTVGGDDRIGIFTTVDVKAGTELSIDYYKSQWYDRGSKVRCYCGSESCVGVLGGRSKGIQQTDAYEWEDDAPRNDVEESRVSTDEDDAPLSSFIKKGFVPNKLKGVSRTKGGGLLQKTSVPVQPPIVPVTLTVKKTHPVKDPPQLVTAESPVFKTAETLSLPRRGRKTLPRRVDSSPRIAELVGKLKEAPLDSRLKKGSTKLPAKLNPLEEEEIKVARKRARLDAEAQRADLSAAVSSEKMLLDSLSRVSAFQRARTAVNKQLVEEVSSCFPVSEAACAEVEFAQELEAAVASDFRKICDDIRPAVKEGQKSGEEVSTTVAQKWCEAQCKKLRSTVEFHFSIIRHLAGPTFALSEDLETDSQL